VSLASEVGIGIDIGIGSGIDVAIELTAPVFIKLLADRVAMLSEIPASIPVRR
jgi:hypothetical protein